MNFQLILLFLTLCFLFIPPLVAVVQIFFKRPLTLHEKVEIFFRNYIVAFVGIQGWLAGLSQIFYSEEVAEYIGWPYSPFLLEVAFANIAFGVLGVLCIWAKGSFRVATTLGYSIVLLFDAANHIAQAFIYGNLKMGNIGPPLWIDIFVPLLFFSLLYLLKRTEEK